MIHTVTGGVTEFLGESDGGGAQFITDIGGVIDFSGSARPANFHPLSVGSIAGAGTYLIGACQLVVGGNALSTEVSGPIEDGGAGGSLVKVGPGTLTLRHAGNGYSGGTILAAGVLDLAAVGAAGLGAITFTACTQTLRLENGALSGQAFANHLDGFAAGNVIDLPGLPFNPGATASFNAGAQTLTVKSGGTIVTLSSLAEPPGTRFAALGDHAGGTEVRRAIIGTPASNTIDGIHHPAGQRSPGGGPDVLLGLAGNDILKGLGGDDILVGGLGQDRLLGGLGADHFVFQRVIDSPVAAPDTIMSLSHAQGDVIDLFDIDADRTHAGNQAFVFIGAQTFAHYHATHHSVIGMVRFAGGVLQGNLNADLAADFAIAVHTPAALHVGDLIL
jgi:autotransporter-associated beta strand protein